jgi:hypothetical protein
MLVDCKNLIQIDSNGGTAIVSFQKVCDYSDDCGDGSDEINCGKYTRCDFESTQDQFCGWNSDIDVDLRWMRTIGSRFDDDFDFPDFGLMFLL